MQSLLMHWPGIICLHYTAQHLCAQLSCARSRSSTIRLVLHVDSGPRYESGFQQIAQASSGVDGFAVEDKEKLVVVQGNCYVRKLIQAKCEEEGLTYS
ncbi:hypothetical protein GN244_ATG17090 [Phytophthora infestans]|uniref:Uncharacterized protein n=1 Tax=Phytophthora infestans TaxID=4787 RepID=A0A833SAQ8_PHYIN|nr:hypothetical protein GN244_ATG17090 [Phytophthora infestans]